MNLKQTKTFCAILVTSFMMSIIPSGSSTQYWEVREISNNEPRRKYEALITGSAYAWNGRYCGGVIISSRYILTIYACTRGDYGISKDLKVYVGFNRISFLNDVPSDGTPYEVSYVHNIRDEKILSSYGRFDPGYRENGYIFLAVVATKENIKIGPNVDIVKLPKGPLLQYFDVRDAEVSGVIYKRNEYEKNKFQLRIIQGRRSCDPSKIKNIPIWLIPSCLEYKDPSTEKDWWFPMGSSLVFNDTLIGIKNHYARYPGYPFDSVTKYSLYINIAYYVEYLDKYTIPK